MLLHRWKSLLVLCSLASPLFAGTVHVPGDYATLQAALDAVPTGTVILVAGGTHPPLRIDRPVTVVGAPRFTVDNTGVADPLLESKLADAITLHGPGAALDQPPLVLANFETRGKATGIIFSWSGAGVAGGGFREVWLVDATIRAAEWFELTGVARGADGIAVLDVPLLLVERCTVLGGFSDADACDYASAPDGGTGLRADATRVVLLDSTVRGGDGPQMCFTEGWCPGGPCPCLPESNGGMGLLAAELLRSGSSVSGGAGQPVYCGALNLGDEEDGPDVVCSSVADLPASLAVSGPTTLGDMLTLSWTARGPALLLVSPAVTAQAKDLGPLKGLLFLQAPILALPAGDASMLLVRVPSDAAWLGAVFGLQLFELDGLGNPVVLVVED